jgi:hypothetical protein
MSHQLGTSATRPRLFHGFARAAHRVWDRQKLARQLGLPFSEETCTETILLDLKSENYSQLTVVAFNKREEGLIGADWEWCFYDLNRSKFLPMLVQAKLLDNDQKRYRHIERTIGRSTFRQVDRLIETPSRRSIPAYYMFYNYLSDTSRIPTNVCSCISNCASCWGCSMAEAEAVLNCLPDDTFDTLRRVSQPLACLFCYQHVPHRHRLQPAEIALQGLRELRVRSLEFGVQPRDESPHLRSEPPTYLSLALEATRSSEVAKQRLFRELENDNPGISGFVLVGPT